ncbi:MAG: rod shape-determining protein MreC [Deltaproteobacteria bacterium]|nr:rod shape-determining protein MreC [Deltaproteobacteria bacterium]
MFSFIKRHQIILASAVLGLISLHLASTTRKGTGGEVIVRAVLSATAAPFQKALLAAEGKVAGVWSGYVYFVGLKKENAELGKTVQSLVEENLRLREEASLNARLKELLRFKDDFPPRTLAARIIGMSDFGLSGGWTRTIVLDAGSGDGVGVDMPVVSHRGVVGRIIAVTSRTSTALLITDPRSAVDVIDQRTRIKGLAEGNGEELVLKYIRRLDDVAVGDGLVTTGLSPVFPRGLSVGTVTKVENGEDNFFKHIEVGPASDIKKLEEVLVITDGNTAGADKTEGGQPTVPDGRVRKGKPQTRGKERP